MALTRINNQALTNVTSAGLPSGTMLQVKQGLGTTFTTVQQDGYVDLMSVNITPSSSSSKILINVVVAYGSTTNGYAAGRVLRVVGATDTALRVGDSYFTENRFDEASFALQGNSSNDTYKVWNTAFNYLDSPATTSQITYKVQGRADASYSSRAMYFNRSETNPGDGYNPPPWSTITVTEIAG